MTRVRTPHYDIYASAEGEPAERVRTGAVRHHVDRYITREGALAKARTFLRQGRSVSIVPVSPDTPHPGEAS